MADKIINIVVGVETPTYQLKQYADALKDINIALKWNPNNEKLLEFRKIINDAKGDKNES